MCSRNFGASPRNFVVTLRIFGVNPRDFDADPLDFLVDQRETFADQRSPGHWEFGLAILAAAVMVEEFLKTYAARRTADRSSKRLAKMRS